MDPLKTKIAKAALEAATAAIGDDLEGTHMVELIQSDPLVRQVRVTTTDPAERSHGPRYFMIRVSEGL